MMEDKTMKHEHTPAPWMIEDNNDNLVIHNEQRDIAAIYDVTDNYSKHEKEDRANARLIAAAPELLDLLHVILMQHKTDGAYSSKGEVVLSPAMERAVESALKKHGLDR